MTDRRDTPPPRSDSDAPGSVPPQPPETTPQTSRTTARSSTADGGSQTDVVVRGIKRMITGGRLGPGSRLPVEKDLAIEFGVSRGSLREGVRALCIMGVLETRQGDGTYVTSLDSDLLLAPMSFMVDLQAPGEQHHLHAVRRVLESEAAARAALTISAEDLEEAARILDRVEPLVLTEGTIDHEAVMDADVAFHRIIGHAAGNSALAALIDALASRTVRARMWLAMQREAQVRTAYREHVTILRALQARDPDRARLLMGAHLLAIEDSVHHAPEIGLDPDQ